MSEIFVLLANPEAGGGLPHQWWPRLQAALAEKALPFHVESESDPARLTRRAREWASEPIRAILALGGDGTVHAIAEGLLDAVLSGVGYLPLGIVPLGRTNDVATQLGLPPDDPVAALRQVVSAQPRHMDVGLARVHGKEHRFLCGVTMGLAATLFQASTPPLPNKGRAPVGTEMTLSFGGQTRRTDVSWLAVGNGPVQGGRYRLTPDARPDDGALELCITRGLSAAEAPAMLRKVETGQHVQSALVSSERIRTLNVVSSQPLPVAIDGELLPQPATTVDIELLQGHLLVLA